MTWRAWSSDADGGVRTSILTAQTTPAPDLTRRVTPQNPRSQHYHHDFAEALHKTRTGARHESTPADPGSAAGAAAHHATTIKPTLSHGGGTPRPGRVIHITIWLHVLTGITYSYSV